LTSDRKLSESARTALTKLFSIPEVADAQALTLNAVSTSELEQCERVIGLDYASPQFRAGVAEAVTTCILTHFARLRRTSEICGELVIVNKRAEAAAMALQQLATALDQAALQDLLLERLGATDLISPLVVSRLRDLAASAAQFADLCRARDKGGAPRMYAFSLLVTMLASAFNEATGRRAALTYNHHHGRYEGPFWNLLSTVLPKVSLIAEQSGRRLAQPSTADARGKYIARVLGGMDKTDRATA
jgi:hypothetical protein